jgi:hypothetical protein
LGEEGCGKRISETLRIDKSQITGKDHLMLQGIE